MKQSFLISKENITLQIYDLILSLCAIKVLCRVEISFSGPKIIDIERAVWRGVLIKTCIYPYETIFCIAQYEAKTPKEPILTSSYSSFNIDYFRSTKAYLDST
jgi:hypothetical protein